MNFLNSQSKSHFWILKLLVKLLFLLIFLFFFVHFVLLNYKFSRSLLHSTHQTSYILILHFCFHIFVLFFIILLFTTVFIIFISHYKQHHLLFQIFLFCNFAYSCCLRLHFKKTSYVFILTWFPLYTAFIIFVSDKFLKLYLCFRICRWTLKNTLHNYALNIQKRKWRNFE